MIVYGPVPSRRLGYSLGINHIPPKHCSYSCVYCQVGRTTSLEVTRRQYYSVEMIIAEVAQKLNKCNSEGIQVDYLSLVPDGEPTLDINLGELIDQLKQFKTKVAVIANSSLLPDEVVRLELRKADWVSVKNDSVLENEWKAINRPHGKLNLSSILDAIIQFRNEYRGELVTETMLVSGVNDNAESINALASYLLKLSPNISYFSIPIRPPAEKWVEEPDTKRLVKLLEQIREKCDFVKPLFLPEEDEFVATGDFAQDVLAITSVHPIREVALRKLAAKVGCEWKIVEEMVNNGTLGCYHYGEDIFYRRVFVDKKQTA